MTPTTVQTQVNAAGANGAANQAALNAQQAGLKTQYGTAVTGANTANTNATNAANSIENGGTLYGQNLGSLEGQFGFNPASLTEANKNLTAIQNQVAYAPTAAANTGNYYGTSSGGNTNIYSGLMSNLNPALTNATNSVGNLTNEFGQLTNAANQQTGLTVTSEQNKATDLATVYTQAVQQMQVAGQTMTTIENLVQQQGYITAEQQTQYTQAYANMQAAQASAATAQNQIAQSQLTGSQTTAQNAANAAAAAALKAKSTPVAPKPATVTSPSLKSTGLGGIFGNNSYRTVGQY